MDASTIILAVKEIGLLPAGLLAFLAILAWLAVAHAVRRRRARAIEASYKALVRRAGGAGY